MNHKPNTPENPPTQMNPSSEIKPLPQSYDNLQIPESQGDLADQAELEIENDISERIHEIQRKLRQNQKS